MEIKLNWICSKVKTADFSEGAGGASYRLFYYAEAKVFDRRVRLAKGRAILDTFHAI